MQQMGGMGGGRQPNLDVRKGGRLGEERNGDLRKGGGGGGEVGEERDGIRYALG